MQDILNHFREQSQHTAPDISHFISDGEPPLGSNPGGVHIDPYTHQKHYVKIYDNPDQARSEVAASHIYNLLGAKTVNPQLGYYHGKLATVSKWRDDIKPLKKEDYNNLTNDQKHDLANHFHAAVLTKNWDSVGTGWSNLGQDTSGKLHTIDTGGTFNFRAMGSHKDFGPDIAEHNSLRDHGVNHYSAHSFSKLEPEHHQESLENVNTLNSDHVHDIIAKHGLKPEIANNILARRNALISNNASA